MPPTTTFTAADQLRVQGPKLALRYPREHDAQALFELASDPEVTKHFSWGPYQSPEQALRWIRSLPTRREGGLFLEFAVTDENENVLGITCLTEPSLRDRRALVGTWFGRDHWGTGANQQSKALVAALAFGPLRLERLSAYADVNNLRSQHALERIGFAKEGVLRAFHRHYDSPRDVLSYSLLRSDWEQSPIYEPTAQIGGLAPNEWIAAPR